MRLTERSLAAKGIEMHIVHIGLGKTATTTLQRHIFPRLKEMGLVDTYNDEQFMSLIIKGKRIGLSEEENISLRTRLNTPETHFISFESAVNWNPFFWRQACKRNLQMLGPETIIMISIREPLSHLTSIYQDAVCGGNVVEPGQFFLPQSEYELIRPIPRSHSMKAFSVSQFCLEELVEMYQSAFSKVVVVPVSALPTFNFLRAFLEIHEEQVRLLRERFQHAPKENVSFSSTVMRMTFAREKVLNAFGLYSVRTFDRRARRLDRLAEMKEWQHFARISELSFPELIRQLPYRLSRRLRWGNMMQRTVNKCLPYEKYTLPPCVIPAEILEKNKDFYSTICQSEKGYRVFEGPVARD